MKLPIIFHALLALVFAVEISAAEIAVPDKEKQAVVDQQIKLETLDIIRNARTLVEEIGFPEKQRLSVYLTHAQGRYFVLEKVTLLIDDTDKTSFEYESAQQQALLRGGGNRIYLGMVTEGLHELVAVFEGHDRDRNIIKKAMTWFFEKQSDGVVLEIRVNDNEATQRPEFVLNQLGVKQTGAAQK